MKLLIAYDVATATPAGRSRLRAVARACKDYGQRVQKSVFECSLGPAEWVALKGRLLGLIEPSQDSLRVYHLEADVVVEHHGANEPIDLDGPLIA